MSDGRVTISVPATPPSLNAWLSSHWRVRASDKDQWETLLRLQFRKWNLPLDCDRIEAEIAFRYPDKRRPDCDNVTATLSKMLGDALQPDWIVNDDSTRFWVRDSRIVEAAGPRETTITLEYWLSQVIEVAA